MKIDESEFIIVLAPMAGITNGEFCKKMALLGFDMVTLGGYNVDDHTIEAGRKILARGRPEFDIKKENIILEIERQAEIIKNSTNAMVSVNLRSVSPDPIIEISKLKGIDVVEINAHCRQPELTEIGCGQALLSNLDKLKYLLDEVVKKSKSKVSVKIRANIPGNDDLKISRIIQDGGADYLHVDAMKPGFEMADYQLIRSIKGTTDIFLIGNNSIRNIETAREMLDAGSNAISIARATMGGNIPFDLSLI
ncbi:MAG: tRNA-dihydrouridine synthase [Methanobacteriaceae archaeon]|nr:tRNA-dihydrouridine synthase [Methanobacteriaceae archaeon]